MEDQATTKMVIVVIVMIIRMSLLRRQHKTYTNHKIPAVEVRPRYKLCGVFTESIMFRDQLNLLELKPLLKTASLSFTDL